MTTTEYKDPIEVGETKEMLKESFETTSEKSKQAIKEILNAYSTHTKTAIEHHQKSIGSVVKRLEDCSVDSPYLRMLYTSVGKSSEFSEEMMQAIIDTYNIKVNLAIKFNEKFLETIKEENTAKNEISPGQMTILKNNLIESIQHSLNTMKDFISKYNRHLNLSVNFNSNLLNSINTNMATVSEIYKKQHNMMHDWTSNWWESISEENGSMNDVISNQNNVTTS